MSAASSPHAQIETDFFCARCGYNLHGLPVTRDERLDLLLVRCCECGGFQPVGSGSTISTLWMQRLATLGLALWILFCTGVVALLGFLIGVLIFAHFDVSTVYGRWTADGRIAYYDFTHNGFAFSDTRIPLTTAETGALNSQTYSPRKQPRPAKPLDQLLVDAPAIFILPAILFSTAAVLGGGFSIIAWHWRKGRERWVLILPLIIVIATTTIYLSGYNPWVSAGFFYGLILFVFVLTLLGCAAGLKFGRATARAFARMFIPAKTRQLLAFLWTADGLAMPGPVVKA